MQAQGERDAVRKRPIVGFTALTLSLIGAIAFVLGGLEYFRLALGSALGVNVDPELLVAPGVAAIAGLALLVLGFFTGLAGVILNRGRLPGIAAILIAVAPPLLVLLMFS